MRRTDRGMWLLAFGVSATILAWAAPSTAGEEGERVTIRAELGAEYDDNVHRAAVIQGITEPAGVVGSGVSRGVLGLSAADTLPHGQDVAFSILGAGKLFLAPAARSENVFVVDNSGSWRMATDDHGKVGLGATYYEATQSGTETERALSGEARDFRSVVPSLRLWRYFGSADILSLAAGYRWFVYKPQRSYDFRAPVVSVEYRVIRETADGDADWELAASAGVELRRFAGTRLVTSPAGCTPDTCTRIFDPSGARQSDQFFTGQIDVTRTGRVLVGAGYAIQWNRSNSVSESLVRHVGTIRLTTPLPLGLYLAARAELVYATYPNAITLDTTGTPGAIATGPAGQPSASIEEETRSQVRAELSRDLTKQLQVMARYSFYANALGQGVGDYRRQTATLSLVYTND